jgi:hypothetical protein
VGEWETRRNTTGGMAAIFSPCLFVSPLLVLNVSPLPAVGEGPGVRGRASHDVVRQFAIVQTRQYERLPPRSSLSQPRPTV